VSGREAVLHLTRDPVWADLIRRIGRPRLQIERGRSPFEALMRAIAHQQLHGNAARAILARMIALYPEDVFPTPSQILSTSEAALKACGFSGTKIACLREIASRALDGTIPTRRQALRMPDVELIQRLTAIRGVGQWTVEMMLIFTLGRPDILPVDDFGVRDGYRALHCLDAPPKPKDLAAIGEAWSPFRSTAAWYLWRASDEAKKAREPTSRA
jgi:DNA-3-methyladenine glycosylase II